MIKVLGLLGSARKGGNSEVLLQNVIEGIKNTNVKTEIETVRLATLKINPCLNCGGCDETGSCVQKDDMQELFEKLLTSTKKMIDRCQALWVRKYRLKQLPDKPRETRKGVYLGVSGMKKPTVFDGAKLTVQSFFATIHVTYIGNLLFSGIDEKGDLNKHPTALSDARKLGELLVNEFHNPDFRLTDYTSTMMDEHHRK
jgi:hypothetical protein